MEPADANDEPHFLNLTSAQCQKVVIQLNETLKTSEALKKWKTADEIFVYFLEPLRRYGYHNMNNETPMTLGNLIHEVNTLIFRETFIKYKVTLDEGEYSTLRWITTNVQWKSNKPFTMSHIFSLVARSDSRKELTESPVYSYSKTLSVLAAFVQHLCQATTTDEFASEMLSFGVFLFETLANTQHAMCKFWNTLLQMYYCTPEFEELVKQHPELAILRDPSFFQTHYILPPAPAPQPMFQYNTAPPQVPMQLLPAPLWPPPPCPPPNQAHDPWAAAILGIMNNPQHPLFWQVFSMMQACLAGQNNIPPVPPIVNQSTFIPSRPIGMFPPQANGFAAPALLSSTVPAVMKAPSAPVLPKEHVFVRPYPPIYLRGDLRSETPGVPAIARTRPTRPSTAGAFKQRAYFPANVQQALQERFQRSRYISDGEAREFLEDYREYGIEVNQIKNWFLNQRSKIKRDAKTASKNGN